jgi:ADP-ribose pyrophosphatase YjhB (NUDIX family)
MLLLRRLEPLARPLLHAYARWTRAMTLGVRGLVRDGEGRVLLIKHTYVSGWHMPGGGVERGETCEHALAREMIEEAGVELTGPPRLRSIHSSEANFRGDHILFFEVGEWRAVKATSRGEIAALGWFAPDALPEDTTTGTRRRITEALFEGEAPADPIW